MTSGMARPRACGQAITSTVTVRSTASSALPSSVQAMNVMTPAAGGEVEQEGGRPVGEGLGPRGGGLGLGHEPLDPGEGGVLAGAVDLDPEASCPWRWSPRPPGRRRRAGRSWTRP